MAKRGHRVMAIAPRYKDYPEALDTGVRWTFPIMGGDQEVGYFHAVIDGVDFVFIDHSCFHHVKDSIYAGELCALSPPLPLVARLPMTRVTRCRVEEVTAACLGGAGNREQQSFRFQLLCRAALEAVWHVKCGGSNFGDHNTVFIANDWQTSLLPVYLQAYYRDHGKMLGARSIIVLHNCAFQVTFPRSSRRVPAPTGTSPDAGDKGWTHTRRGAGRTRWQTS
jgi:starch synthase